MDSISSVSSDWASKIPRISRNSSPGSQYAGSTVMLRTSDTPSVPSVKSNKSSQRQLVFSVGKKEEVDEKELQRVGSLKRLGSLNGKKPLLKKSESMLTSSSEVRPKKKRCCFCCFSPCRSITGCIMVGPLLFALMLMMVSGGWTTLFSICVVELRNGFRETSLNGLKHHLSQQNDLIHICAHGLKSTFYRRSNETTLDLEKAGGLLRDHFRHMMASDIGHSTLEHLFFSYRPRRDYLVGYGTKGFQTQDFSYGYMWPGVSREGEIIGYELKQLTDTPMEENRFNYTMSPLSEDVFKVMISNEVVVAPLELLCLKKCQPLITISVPLNDTMNGDPYNGGYASVSFNPFSSRFFFQEYLSDYDMSLVIDTKGNIVATSEEVAGGDYYSVVNGVPSLYHYEDNPYPDSEVQSHAKKVMALAKDNPEKGSYMTSKYYVDYERVKLSETYSYYAIQMTNTSIYLVLPLVGSILIWIFGVLLTIMALCMAVCTGLSMRRSIKILISNMDKMKDLRLDEVVAFKKGSFFQEIRELQYQFQLMFKQLVEISHFLPDHILHVKEEHSSHSGSQDSFERHAGASIATPSHIPGEEIEMTSVQLFSPSPGGEVSRPQTQESLVASSPGSRRDSFAVDRIRSSSFAERSRASSFAERSRASSFADKAYSPVERARASSFVGEKNRTTSFIVDRSRSGSFAEKTKPPLKRTKTKVIRPFNLHLKSSKLCCLTVHFHDIDKVLDESLDTFCDEYQRIFSEIKRITNIHRSLFIEKFSSKEVVVIFKKSSHACDAAFQLFKCLQTLYKENPALKYSMALSSGAVYNGIIGDKQMKRRHAFGRVVKSSRKLAKFAYKQFGVHISVNDSLIGDIKNNFQYRPISKFQVGSRKYQAYELIRKHSLHVQQEWIYIHREKMIQKSYDDFATAYDLYENQEYQEAKSLFEKFEVDYPHDNVVHYYLRECSDKIGSKQDPKLATQAEIELQALNQNDVHPIFGVETSDQITPRDDR